MNYMGENLAFVCLRKLVSKKELEKRFVAMEATASAALTRFARIRLYQRTLQSRAPMAEREEKKGRKVGVVRIARCFAIRIVLLLVLQ